MPVPVIPSQPGGLQGEDGADMPFPYRRQQVAQAWALVASGPTPTDIFIDHDHAGKPQRTGLLGEGIWPPRALRVGADLMACGLADIDRGITLEMARVNRGAHGDTPRAGHCG